MGILLIVFSSVYMLYSLMAAAGTLFSESFMDILPIIAGAAPEIKKSGINLELIFSQLRGVYRMQGLEKLMTAAISGFGLFAGIKLMQFTQQGLRLAVWWAITALTSLVIEVWIFVIYVNPLVKKFLKTLTEQVKPLLGKDAPSVEAVMNLAGGMGLSSIISSAVIMAVFPIVMLALMNTAAAKKACGVDNVFA